MIVPVSGVDMTAAPELSETITHSRVESSLARPEPRTGSRCILTQ